MKKVVFIVFLCISFLSYSQDENTNQNSNSENQQNDKTSDFWENVRFGGGFGLSFGNVTTLGINPTAIYDFNDKFSLGASLGYTYSKNDNQRLNIYTGSILSIFTPFKNFQFSGELEQLFVNQKIGTFKNSYNYPALYLGLAYTTRNISIGGRFDVLYNESKSIYSSPFSPIIRVFF